MWHSQTEQTKKARMEKAILAKLTLYELWKDSDMQLRYWLEKRYNSWLGSVIARFDHQYGSSLSMY